MKNEILRLRCEGKSYDEISNILKCSKSTISYHCHPQKNVWAMNRKRTRNNLKNKIKKDFGGKCCICGYDRCMSSLHFHHKNSDTKVSEVMTLLYEKSKKDAYREAKKCILVCANCHGEIHEGLNKN